MGIFDRRPQEDEDIPASFLSKPYNTPRPIISSAARVNLKDEGQVAALGKRKLTDTWQTEAWDYYDLVGEVKSSANLISNVTSRVNIYGGYVTSSSTVPSDIGRMEDKLDEDFIKAVQDTIYTLESGNGGSAGLLRTAALSLFVVGECYLVREPSVFGSPEPTKYSIRSVDEIVATTDRNARVAIKPRRDAKPTEYIPISDHNGYVCRMWRNHPRYSDEADSSMRGVLELCDDLLLLSRAVSATAKSRLNAGLLFVPDEISNISESDGEAIGEDAEYSDDVSESFEEGLIDSMITPIADVSSAAAVVPIIVRGPQDMGDKIRLIKFERTYDPALTAQADKLLERILGSLDIPADVAKGLSGVKYSNAILIEEQLYKAHVEPLILMIVDQLTIGFLRPALRAQGFPEHLVNRAVVWYDPTAITAKPSRAEASLPLYDKRAISLAALRRANGFAEEDAPTNLETAQRLAIERGLLDEQTSATLFNTIIPEDLQKKSREDALANSDEASVQSLEDAITPEEGAPTEEPSEPPAPPTLMEP